MTKTITDFLQPDARPAVMGILNITPDSFFDGGQLYGATGPFMDAVLHRAEAMLVAGADILDVGGESTRPGAVPLSEQEELDRVLPVVAALAARFPAPVSIDSRPGALAAAAGTGQAVCLMHMQGEPGSMQDEPRYRDVVAEVTDFLLARVDACAANGIPRDRILIDPGFGFGKTLAHNLALFRALPGICALGLPVLVGVSRKRMIGDILGKPVAERLIGSVALALLAAQAGARILRVHDVAATVDALTMFQAIQEQ